MWIQLFPVSIDSKANLSTTSTITLLSKNGDVLLKLSLIITAHNEELRIEEKLHNTLEIDYPSELLDIIVASDCSTDGTDRIVESCGEQGIRLVRVDEHKGKEYAQLCAIQEARADTLIFSDVSTKIARNAFHLLAKAFSEPLIGAISSEDRLGQPTGWPRRGGSQGRDEQSNCRHGDFQYGIRHVTKFFNNLPGRSLRYLHNKAGLCGTHTRKTHARNCRGLLVVASIPSLLNITTMHSSSGLRCLSITDATVIGPILPR